MVFGKYRHALIKLRILVVFYKRCAYTQSFLLRTCRYETYSADTVVHQFVSQLTAGHTLVAYREVESVGNRLVEVLIVNHVESMTQEYFLQFMSTLAVNLYVVAEIVVSVACSLQQFCQTVLCAVACAR